MTTEAARPPRRHHGHLCADEDQIRERLERDRADLLAALESFLEWGAAENRCTDCIDADCSICGECDCDWSDRVLQARAAIARARGDA